MSILFRRISNPCPEYWRPGSHWYVEFHETEKPFPLGIAFVTASPKGKQYSGDVQLDGVYVLDHCRREGIATRLLQACEARWPDIQVVGAMNEAEEALHKKVLGSDEHDGAAPRSRDQKKPRPRKRKVGSKRSQKTSGRQRRN